MEAAGGSGARAVPNPGRRSRGSRSCIRFPGVKVTQRNGADSWIRCWGCKRRKKQPARHFDPLLYTGYVALGTARVPAWLHLDETDADETQMRASDVDSLIASRSMMRTLPVVPSPTRAG